MRSNIAYKLTQEQIDFRSSIIRKRSKNNNMIAEVIRGVILDRKIDFVLEECCSCGIPFFMPTYHQKMLISKPGTAFYCPNGHIQHYTGPTEADKLKKEIEEEKIRYKNSLEIYQNKWLDALNDKKKVEKDLIRLKKGVCPCCNRTFLNLHNHMKKQHPDYATK